MTPSHYEPRDEDGRYVGEFWQGVALTMWGGFDLRPRNLFGGTPLFTPGASNVPPAHALHAMAGQRSAARHPLDALGSQAATRSECDARSDE